MVHSKNESGFAHVVILIVLIMIAVIGFVGWRVMVPGDNKDKTEDLPSKSAAAEATIALQNVGVNLDHILVSNYAVSEYNSKGLKGFYIFGDELSRGRINPNFEYASLKEDTKVISAIDGMVAFIKEQAPGDVEVFIQPKEGSMWTVGYDHIANVAVKKGDSIKAGAIIGEPALQNNGLTRFELQINKDENGKTTHYCPSTLLAVDVKQDILNSLGAMQNKWEQQTGLDLYDLAAQNPIGCAKATLSPEEAEGR